MVAGPGVLFAVATVLAVAVQARLRPSHLTIAEYPQAWQQEAVLVQRLRRSLLPGWQVTIQLLRGLGKVAKRPSTTRSLSTVGGRIGVGTVKSMGVGCGSLRAKM